MFYIYALIDPRSNTPFYIGKGTENRVTSHEKFKSKCNNLHKDRVITKILSAYDKIPFVILKDNIVCEDDAYAYEEAIIAIIGIANLTNMLSSCRPPLQKGKLRSSETKVKITQNSMKQGAVRTINHVVANKGLIFATLTDINSGVRRHDTLSKLTITTDLYNKIKRKYSLYVELLNAHTEFNIPHKNLIKLNGMQVKVFSSKKETLIEIYKLIASGAPRRKIVEQLSITLAFYNRVKNKQDQFNEYLSVYGTDVDTI